MLTEDCSNEMLELSGIVYLVLNSYTLFGCRIESERKESESKESGRKEKE